MAWCREGWDWGIGSCVGVEACLLSIVVVVVVGEACLWGVGRLGLRAVLQRDGNTGPSVSIEAGLPTIASFVIPAARIVAAVTVHLRVPGIDNLFPSRGGTLDIPEAVRTGAAFLVFTAVFLFLLCRAMPVAMFQKFGVPFL